MLDRPVYGIANPRFYAAKQWTSIAEMGRHYARLVKTVVPSGPVLLGGWSLGGMLALEVAKVLADDPDLRVVGMVMIDSVCTLAPPGGWVDPPAPVVVRKFEWTDNTRVETRVAIERCFIESGRMAWSGSPPTWEAESKGVRRARRMPPPAMLLRSQDAVPVEGGILAVDLYREDRRLGWDNYRKGLFSRIVDIPGHHFSVFVEQHLDKVSSELRLACNALEDMMETLRYY